MFYLELTGNNSSGIPKGLNADNCLKVFFSGCSVNILISDSFVNLEDVMLIPDSFEVLEDVMLVPDSFVILDDVTLVPNSFVVLEDVTLVPDSFLFLKMLC